MNQKGVKEKQGKRETQERKRPHMKSFQVKGKETEELEQLYKKLEQGWQANKQSNSTTTASSSKFLAPSKATIKKPIQQRDNSPRDFMSRLQQESSSPEEALKNVMMTRTKDLAMKEILQERREAIESGKLKGRRLFQPMVEEAESESAEKGPHREVRSMSFYYSEDESSGSKGLQYGCTPRCSYSSSSSSSSTCLVGASVDKDQEVKGVADIVAMVAKVRVASATIGTTGNGSRYAVFLGGVAIALLVIALCMTLARSSHGHDYDVILVPT